MEKHKVLLEKTVFQEKIKEILKPIAEVNLAKLVDKEMVVSRIRGYDALIIGSSVKCSKEVFEKADKLKIISLLSTGFDNVDLNSATEHNIMVTNVPGVAAESVAEYTFLLILAFLRDFPKHHSRMKRGLWRPKPMSFGYQLWGKTLGLMGLGKIGSLIAYKAAKAFNTRNLVYDSHIREEKVLRVMGTAVTLEELLQKSDIISINLPLTKETYHLIGQDELNQMKKSALIVNTGRGAIIDQKALIQALREDQIGGACLDVFRDEPLPSESPLRKLDNVILSPHLAGNTESCVRRTVEKAARCVFTALREQRPEYLVNTEVWQEANSRNLT